MQAARACWTPETAEGHAYEQGDGVPHWATKADAKESIGAIMARIKKSDWTHGTRPRLVPRRLATGCWHLVCEGCGYSYDADESISHFANESEADEAIDDALDGDWEVILVQGPAALLGNWPSELTMTRGNAS